MNRIPGSLVSSLNYIAIGVFIFSHGFPYSFGYSHISRSTPVTSSSRFARDGEGVLVPRFIFLRLSADVSVNSAILVISPRFMAEIIQEEDSYFNTFILLLFTKE